MSKTAVMVREMGDDRPARQRLYRLSEPVKFRQWTDDAEEVKTADYVVASAVVAFGVPETYLFPADENGVVLDWLELEGSFRGDLDHERAIRNAGYEVTK